MTVKEALNLCVKTISNIKVPVQETEEVAIPLKEVTNILTQIIVTINQKEGGEDERAEG